MFGFAQPAVLLLLVIPIALGYWTWTRKGHSIILPFDHGHQGAGTAWMALINTFELIIPVILATVICIWASPKKNDIPQEKREMTNIQILLDCSGSMMSPFGDEKKPDGTFNDRFDASKAAIEEFIRYRKGDAFGLSLFSNTILHWVPLTLDTSTIPESIDLIRPVKRGRFNENKNIPGLGQGTRTGAGLLACIPELKKRNKGDRMILLISDGHPGDLKGNQPSIIASELAAAHIVVHAVYISDKAPKPNFYEVVQGTGGQVFEANDPETLKRVFREIDKLQKAKVKAKTPLARDDFYIFALVGLIAVFLHILASFKLRYTPW